MNETNHAPLACGQFDSPVSLVFLNNCRSASQFVISKSGVQIPLPAPENQELTDLNL